MSNKIKDNKNKKNVSENFNASKTSKKSSKSFWERLLEVIYKNGGGR